MARRTMTEEEEQQYLEWLKSAEGDAREDLVRNDPLAINFRLREFLSTSNGRGRKARRPREVTLVVRTGENRRPVAYQVVRGELKPRRKSNAIQPDAMANEVLNHLDPSERTTDRLLEEIRRRQKW